MMQCLYVMQWGVLRHTLCKKEEEIERTIFISHFVSWTISRPEHSLRRWT